MFPPKGAGSRVRATGAGLEARKATGHTNFDDAVGAVNDMLGNGGNKGKLKEAILSDEEFDEIQRRHYGKKQKTEAKRRAEKSLVAWKPSLPFGQSLDSSLSRLQHQAIVNDFSTMPDTSEESAIEVSATANENVENLSANTVVKWSVALRRPSSVPTRMPREEGVFEVWSRTRS